MLVDEDGGRFAEEGGGRCGEEWVGWRESGVDKKYVSRGVEEK